MQGGALGSVALGEVPLLVLGLLRIAARLGHAWVGAGLVSGDGLGPGWDACMSLRQAAPASAHRVLRGAELSTTEVPRSCG